MMRLTWLAEEKRRMEQQQRDALYVPASQEEELESEPEQAPSGDATNQGKSDSLVITRDSYLRILDEEMADEIAEQENAELEALLAMMDNQNTNAPPDPPQRLETQYGSDDEEYDDLFMSVIISGDGFDLQGEGNQSTNNEHPKEMDTAMDMS
jgi:hypothetical protein